MWERAVVHLNVAHFAVAVERVVDCRLRQRPVIVAPDGGGGRAVVYDMSQEAYQAGVRKGIPLSRARKLCRDARWISPHLDRYERAMRAFWERTRAYAPLVELVDESGHLFLDLTGTTKLFGPPPDVAWRIRKEVRSALGLEPIWALAANKLVAKVATRLVKPTGEYIVEPGDEAAFLQPLPLRVLPGLEREELRLMQELNLRQVGQVSGLSLSQLQVIIGRAAPSVHDAVRGVDTSPVVPVDQALRAVEQVHTFEDDTNDVAVVEGTSYRLIERIAAQLRQRSLAARRVGVTLDYTDGMRVIRSATSAMATAHDGRLFSLCRLALERAWTRRVRLRGLKIGADRLTYPPAQLELFDEQRVQERHEIQLVAAVDQIRHKFGLGAIQRGRTLVDGVPEGIPA